MFEELKDINKMSDITKKIFIDKGYLVEYKLNEHLKSIVLSNIKKYDSHTLSLSIIPTYNCNFLCEYCFVKKDNSTMEEYVIKAILNFIEKKFKEGINTLLVSWIGGEPLISFEVIKKISYEIIRLSKQYEVNYNAFLITNGSLLTQEIVDEFPNLHIGGLQITIDGDEDVHNINRPMKNGNSYKSILKNLEQINFNRSNVSIRINLDKNNVFNISKTIKEIKNKNILEKIHQIFLSPVFKTKYMDERRRAMCFNNVCEYADYEIEVMKILSKERFPINIDIQGNLPLLGNIEKKLFHFCIDTYGYVYLHEKDFGNFKCSICSIDKLTNQFIFNSQYILESISESNRFYTLCSKCKVFPLCMNGGLQGFECSTIKYNLIDRLKLLIDMEGKNEC
jgi:uncharacterized protein